MSSTRNAKQVSQINALNSYQHQQQETDDFLKKVKLQQSQHTGTGKHLQKDGAVDGQHRRKTDQSHHHQPSG